VSVWRARRLALSLASIVGLWPSVAAANGRFPASVDVHTRPGNEQTILLPTTFGLLLSNDDGASFRWVCENAVGYGGGNYDPDYAIHGDGSIYATTFEGLRVSRDGGCTWTTFADPLTDHWVGEVEIDAAGNVWAATSSGAMANDVFLSTDGGMTFSPKGLLHSAAWWKSLRVAPGDPDRVYVSGYLIAGAKADGGSEPAALLYRSDNGGDTWTELPTGDFVFGTQPQLFVEAISPTNPDIVFARVFGVVGGTGDALYRSTDQGASFTKVLEMEDFITAFHIRPDGATVLAGTVNAGVRISRDGGATFSLLAGAPKMACVGERDDGTLFSCGTNWAPDQFTLGRSTDGATWRKVLRFCEIAGPLSCPAGTMQHDTCEVTLWPALTAQFGIPCGSGDAGPAAVDAAAPDGDGKTGSGTCLGCGIALIGVAFVLPRRRRRKCS
jgi:hypothetical protein